MIYIVGARCEYCGRPLKIEEPHATGEAYINRQDGDKLTTICKNTRLCQDTQEQNRITDNATKNLCT